MWIKPRITTSIPQRNNQVTIQLIKELDYHRKSECNVFGGLLWYKITAVTMCIDFSTPRCVISRVQSSEVKVMHVK